MIRLLAVTITLASACFVGATDCRRVAVVTSGHYATPVAIATYAYPAYSVGYAPDTGELTKEVFQAYKALVEEHKALLKAMAVGGSPALKATLAPSPGLAVLVTNCSGCHSTENAKAKGGGFAWIAAGSFVDEGDNHAKVMAALKTGKMGSRDLPKLADSDKLAAVFHLTMELPEPTAKK